MTMKVCLYCGEEYTGRGAKYCSYDCRDKGIKGINNPNWRGISVKTICEYCGNEFIKNYPTHKFCSIECKDKNHSKWMKEQMKNNIKISKICPQCHQTFKVTPAFKNRRCCSRECQTKYYVKDKAPTWRGGISFDPYCPKFNFEFKARVSDFWNRKCGVCSKTEEENNSLLPVHHVNYEKMVCCDATPPIFVPLCRSCHAKTNHNRIGWEHNLTVFIMIYFDGESYTKQK